MVQEFVGMPFPLPSYASDRSRPNRWREGDHLSWPKKRTEKFVIAASLLFPLSFWQCLPKNDRCLASDRTVSETSVFSSSSAAAKKENAAQREFVCFGKAVFLPFMSCQATGSTLKRSLPSLTAPSIPPERSPSCQSPGGSTSLRGVAKSNFSTGKSPSPPDTFPLSLLCRRNPVGHFVFLAQTVTKVSVAVRPVRLAACLSLSLSFCFIISNQFGIVRASRGKRPFWLFCQSE